MRHGRAGRLSSQGSLLRATYYKAVSLVKLWEMEESCLLDLAIGGIRPHLRRAAFTSRTKCRELSGLGNPEVRIQWSGCCVLTRLLQPMPTLPTLATVLSAHSSRSLGFNEATISLLKTSYRPVSLLNISKAGRGAA